MKRFFFGLTLALIFFGVLELGLRAAGFQGNPVVGDFRFRIIGELHGEPDQYRFWKLPHVEPRFSGDVPRIICMADSVTVMEQGFGWPNILPEALRRAGYLKPVEVFNAGVPEYTSFQGLQYLRHELLATQPNLVTIEFGWNDHWETRTGKADDEIHPPSAALLSLQAGLGRLRLYRLLLTFISPRPQPQHNLRVPLDRYRDNLWKMIEMVNGQGGKVILIPAPYLDGPWGWRDLHLSYIQATREVAAQTGTTIVDLVDKFIQAPQLFYDPRSDACHYNMQGGRMIADAVAAATVSGKLLD